MEPVSSVSLTLEEARALRAYVLGDHFEVDPISAFLKKTEEIYDEDDD